MLLDSSQRYGTISRFLHWSMAICFGFMLYTGLQGEDAFRELLPYHKSVGTILMALIAVRIIWAMLNHHKRPKAANIFVTLGHLALYVLMLAIPTVALIRQYGAARGPLEVFGVNVMEGSSERIIWMVELAEWHGEMAWALFVLAAGHIAMAIFHQIRGEKILNRMAH